MSAKPYVLGISISHNASSCLLSGDEIVAAIQEERLLRWKRATASARYIRLSVEYCLDAAGIGPDDLSIIAVAPVTGPHSTPDADVFLNEYLRPSFYGTRIVTVPHHLGHAYSAYANSGFESCSVLVIDGSGYRFDSLSRQEQGVVLNVSPSANSQEWLSWYDADEGSVKPVMKQVQEPHSYVDPEGLSNFGSIGDMYGAIGHHIFGDFFNGPGKVMGLAPYGRPSTPVDDWLSVDSRGLFSFSPAGYDSGRQSCRWPSDFQGCANFAAAVQAATEAGLLEIATRIAKQDDTGKLAYSGGVALNSVANEKLIQRQLFSDVFVYPAAEDSGVAVGAAFYALSQIQKLKPHRLRNDSTGRCYSTEQVNRAIAAFPNVAIKESGDIHSDVSKLLQDGKIVGWFLGGSELGPRALGHRSILCDPRRTDGKDVLNLRVKHRESYQPFAPIVLREHVTEWFETSEELGDSPFMLRVMKFRSEKGDQVPAVRHVDCTGRLQTLTPENNAVLYKVLKLFYKDTGVPIILNTSFNIAGEPIIETPQDALWCMLYTGVDCVVFNGEIISAKDADFSSVLDLIPHLRTTALVTYSRIKKKFVLDYSSPMAETMNMPVHKPLVHPVHYLDNRQLVPGVVRFITSAQPGQAGTYRLLDHQSASILETIDGEVTARRIAAELSLTDEFMHKQLGRLYRAGLISVST